MYTVDVYCYSIGHNSKEKMNLNKEKNITFFFGQHAIDVYVYIRNANRKHEVVRAESHVDFLSLPYF